MFKVSRDLGSTETQLQDKDVSKIHCAKDIADLCSRSMRSVSIIFVSDVFSRHLLLSK